MDTGRRLYSAGDRDGAALEFQQVIEQRGLSLVDYTEAVC
jgi:hypothetical protein